MSLICFGESRARKAESPKPRFADKAMRFFREQRWVGWILWISAVASVGDFLSASAQDSKPTSFANFARPFIQQYCADCHGDEKQKADLNLEAFEGHPALYKKRELWESVRDMLAEREMPPEKKAQPSEDERIRMVQFINEELAKFDCAELSRPGRVTLRRLNRAEYNNTIRDLMGVDFSAAADFPLDEVGYGFDNIGDVLSLSPILMEKYLAAAERIVSQAVLSELPGCPPLLLESRAHPSPKALATDRHPKKSARAEESDLESARRFFTAFVPRAYRRPASPEEIQRLLGLTSNALEQNANLEESVGIAVQAVLASPGFLYRWELDPEVDDGNSQNLAAVRSLNPYEFASRLSYFLWSSMPDDVLFGLAAAGTLLEPAVVKTQVRRMLADPKSTVLATNFAGQWLQFRQIETIAPDPELFPAFDEELRQAMRRESELFFEAVMREDRSILEFLDADFTFVNRRLADHYQIAGEFGAEFQRVRLNAQSARGGILTQAGTLALTANPTRTSPVIRGKWVLEQILGTPPPPPPPEVEELEESQEAAAASLRERLEIHRSQAECAVCHAKMDPIGFAFENFDAVGAWRDLDGAFPIDASGELPDGRRFNGHKELIAILKTEETFPRTVVEKMLTFALGRGLEYYDKCATDEILAAAKRADFRFSALVVAIVMSDPFQKVSLQHESQ